MTGLVVAPCSHEAALFACQHWHYSRKPPVGKLIKFGVWEQASFIGSVIYGQGANHHMASFLSVKTFEACELVRVALRLHQTPVTQIMAETLRSIAASNPGLRVVLSYADPAEGHLGRIYQAGNWFYLGRSAPQDEFIINGARVHKRTVSKHRDSHPSPMSSRLQWVQTFLDPEAQRLATSSKFRYAYPLDKAMRRSLRRKALPYPVDLGSGLDSASADEGSKVIHPDSIGEGPVRPRASAQPS